MGTSSPCLASRGLLRWWPSRWDIVAPTSSPSAVLGSSSTASLPPSLRWRSDVLQIAAVGDTCSKDSELAVFAFRRDSLLEAHLERQVFCRTSRHFFVAFRHERVKSFPM